MGCLFFNWYGYRLLTDYWQRQADSRLEARIALEDYDESSLITIKLPIDVLPYHNASTVFERVDGEIIIADVAYKYVKRGIVGDSLVLLCLRNTEKMEIKKADNEFFGKVNNFPNSKPTPQKDFQKIYSPANLDLSITLPDPIETPQPNFASYSLSAGHTRRAERPPITG